MEGGDIKECRKIPVLLNIYLRIYALSTPFSINSQGKSFAKELSKILQESRNYSDGGTSGNPRNKIRNSRSENSGFIPRSGGVSALEIGTMPLRLSIIQRDKKQNG